MTRCTRHLGSLALLAIGAVGASLGACTNDNASMTAKVQANVNRAVTSPSADVEVQVDRGVVTLSGTVPSAQMKDRAEQAAKRTDGVKRVNDQLAVGSQK